MGAPVSLNATKPHIVMVVMDDVGHADHEVYVGRNGTDIPTPNLLKLANTGVTFTNYYTQTVSRCWTDAS